MRGAQPAGQPVAMNFHGLAHRPAAGLDDEPGVLQDRNELARLHHAAVGIVPAHQRLEALDRPLTASILGWKKSTSSSLSSALRSRPSISEALGEAQVHFRGIEREALAGRAPSPAPPRRRGTACLRRRRRPGTPEMPARVDTRSSRASMVNGRSSSAAVRSSSTRGRKETFFSIGTSTQNRSASSLDTRARLRRPLSWRWKPATCCGRSPARWPSASLTALKRAMSNAMTAAPWPWCAARPAPPPRRGWSGRTPGWTAPSGIVVREVVELLLLGEERERESDVAGHLL